GVLVEDPGFTALVDRYNTIVMEKERSKLSQTEGNPYVQNLNTQIAGIRGDMLKSIESLKRSLSIAKNAAQNRNNKMDTQVGKVPGIQRKYLDLERQQQIKQELYVFLLQKKEETAISKTSNISNCKVIEKPMSVGPISPNGRSIISYGVFLGLLIPLGAIYLGDVLNTKVKSRDDVTNLTRVPIIGEIGASTSMDTIVVASDSRTPISEQFRNLRTSLSFFLKDKEKRILVTSSMGGEGKSFCSINLAAIIALTGKKVVVMEMDLRKPNLSNKFNLKHTLGYTNYITSEEVTVADIIQPSGLQNNLFVISSGPIPPNPAELLINSRIDGLMEALERDFDYIIMDAPPIGLVTDAQLLSNHADLTLYIVREGYTFKEQLAITEDILRNKKIARMAILLNGATINTSYGYGYGYGSEDTNSDTSFIKKVFKK
ncbi:MAG: polysaccharide biosynthesis tyrosine autokinase, partial [Pedobacter sp.]|nr:polysaccharide biosynthesis tyrosine autokinase [Pedobacter sp.]